MTKYNCFWDGNGNNENVSLRVETKRSVYENTCDILLQQYPDDIYKYPNKLNMNKDRIATAIKIIRKSYKKAVDSGRKSG